MVDDHARCFVMHRRMTYRLIMTTILFCMMRFGKRGRQETFCDAEELTGRAPGDKLER
jgi:hypothetical protein